MKRELKTTTLGQINRTSSESGRPAFGGGKRTWLAGLFAAAAACLLCGSGRAAPTICNLFPSSEVSGNCLGQYTLHIRGKGFNSSPSANIVTFGGVVGSATAITSTGACPGSPSNSLGQLLTVTFPCTAILTSQAFESFPVIVKAFGQDSNPLSFTVYDSSSTALLYTTDVPAGATGYTQTAGNSTGQGGVVAWFHNQGGDPAVMTVVNYAPNLTPAGLLFLPGDPSQPSQLYDLQLTIPSGNLPVGTLAADFYYPFAPDSPYETQPSFFLRYYDGSGGWPAVIGAAVGSWAGDIPNRVHQDTGNNLAGTCCPSGGRFRVTFDDTGNSIPSLMDLSGTIFTMAPAPLTATPETLWPPNHKMRSVTVDAPAGSWIASVSSSDPETGLGQGDVGPDSEIISAQTVRLRAERGNAQGRTYTIVVQLLDGSQNIAVVRVPHDNGKN